MLPTVFLVLAALVLCWALFAVWQSLRAALGVGHVDPAYGAVASDDRATLSDEKHAVLRALKDVEYEHAVGKISEEDFKRLDAQYRARARDVLRALDVEVGTHRADAERLVKQQLDAAARAKKKAVGGAKKRAVAKAAAAPAPAAKAKPAPAPAPVEATDADEHEDEHEDDAEEKEEASAAESEAKSAAQSEAKSAAEPEAKSAAEPAPKSSAEPAEKSPTESPATRAAEGAAKPVSRECAACGTVNDPDATFCKKCAARVAPAEPAATPAEAAAKPDTKESE